MDYMPIIREAIEKARRVKATPEQFRDGLEEWKDSIDEEIAASEESEEESENE